jgi:hypothetical protein
MKSIYHSLNQIYYAIYTLIILMSIFAYFLNLNSILLVNTNATVSLVLLSIQSLLTVIAVSFFTYFQFVLIKLKLKSDNKYKMEKYLRLTRIRLMLIGLNLIVGIVCVYIVRNELTLFLISISAILLLVSKPVEHKINSLFIPDTEDK